MPGIWLHHPELSNSQELWLIDYNQEIDLDFL